MLRVGKVFVSVCTSAAVLILCGSSLTWGGSIKVHGTAKKVLDTSTAVESTPSNTDLYNNDKSTASYPRPPFASGSIGLWGEDVTVVPYPPAAAEIRALVWAAATRQDTRSSAPNHAVYRFSVWDDYDATASPVTSNDVDGDGVTFIKSVLLDFANQLDNSAPFGCVQGVTCSYYVLSSGTFDPGDFINLTTAGNGDSNIFYTWEARVVPPPYDDAAFNAAPVLPSIARGRTTGPDLGTSGDFWLFDANNDNSLTPADISTDSVGCADTPCRHNFHLIISGPPNPNVLDPGIDFLQTANNGQSSYLVNIFGGELDSDDGGGDCTNGTFDSSSPFAGTVLLKGSPLAGDIQGPADLTPIDTIMRRLAGANLPNPGSSAAVPVELLALSLQGTAPITIDRNGNSEQWTVNLCNSGSGASLGLLTVHRGACDGQGGTFDWNINLVPQVVFRRISGGPACTHTLFTGTGPTLITTAAPWFPEAPAALNILEFPFSGFLSVDTNCDGVPDSPLLPGTNAYFPSVSVPHCVGDACDPHVDPIKRLFISADGSTTSLAEYTAENIPESDTDGDGVNDGTDNCPADANSDQLDVDHDGTGEACDNAPGVCNPDQADSDGNGVGDVVDRCFPNPPNCNDGNVCTTDTCDPYIGCVNAPAPGTACDDGNPCTINDACSPQAACVGGGPLNCDDGNPNTADSCNPASGCVHTPINQDADHDGVNDNVDQCPHSIGVGGTVVIEGCDSRVPNVVDSHGCTILDKIAVCSAQFPERHHSHHPHCGSHQRGFLACVDALLRDLQQHHVISSKQRARILRCAAASRRPHSDHHRPRSRGDHH